MDRERGAEPGKGSPRPNFQAPIVTWYIFYKFCSLTLLHSSRQGSQIFLSYFISYGEFSDEKRTPPSPSSVVSPQNSEHSSPLDISPKGLGNAQKLVKSPFTQVATNKVLKPFESDLLWHDIISPRQSIETSETTQQLRNIRIRSTTMSFSKHLDLQQVKVS